MKERKKILKNTLNESFNQWIKEIQSIELKKKELNEKLSFYNMKLGSCKSVNYENLKTSKTYNKGEGIILWLSKIEEVENKIKNLNLLFDNYILFKSTLSNNEQYVLDEIIKHNSAVNIASKLKVSKQRIYDIKNTISRKCDFIIEL